VNPYRESATPVQTRLTRWQRIGLWFCDNGWHSFREKILRGGAGPDDAAAFVKCVRCKISGWRYCDGTYSDFRKGEEE